MNCKDCDQSVDLDRGDHILCGDGSLICNHCESAIFQAEWIKYK